MSEVAFVSLCKKEVIDYTRHRLGVDVTENQVYVVWLSKTLQNNKALLSTALADNLYYEMTYNGDRGELYVDVYNKVDNYTVVV